MPRLKCQECGRALTAVCGAGYIPDLHNPRDPAMTLDFYCSACGWPEFTTADREKAGADEIKKYRDDYERDTASFPVARASSGDLFRFAGTFMGGSVWWR